MSKKSRAKIHEKRNTRTVLEGPAMMIRLNLEVLLLYRKAVENGYEENLSTWINHWIIDTFKETTI